MNYPKTFDIVDADTLMSTALERTRFIVENLIPQGLTLLCGASKAGKSWMMLWLALHVARGLPIWGLETHRCAVLYLCLEDTLARLQDRLYQLTDSAPPELKLTVTGGKIGEGLEEQICHHMALYPDTKLIIIDTLQKVRVSKSNSNVGIYAADYDDISALKRLADELGIAIVVVHHLRKMRDGSDPFNEITGSTGIMGAADSSLLLRCERGEDRASLLATGRDIEYQELILRKDEKKFIWHLEEHKNAKKLRKEKVPVFISRVAAFARREGYWHGTATELLEAMGEREVSHLHVTRYLARFAREQLEPQGVFYSTGRDAGSRYIVLTSNQAPIPHDSDDSNDSNDSKTDIY